MCSVQIIPASQVDPVKWDRCVQEDPCGLIYSRYEYLQQMCDNWVGLVLNDYHGVMALPFRSKWGIRYIYHPAFMQQTGLIGNIPPDWPTVILPVILRHFSYGDIPFHFGNAFSDSQVKQRTNLILSLHPAYTDIAKHYRHDLQQSLKLAGAKHLQYKALAVMDGADFYRCTYQHSPFIQDQEHTRFRQLCSMLFEQGACFARGMYEDNNLLAAAVFLKDDKRIYLIANAVSAEGRKNRANHVLLDAVIREYAESGLLLDFEGSDIPGVKEFYYAFAAIPQPYYYWHFNRLPWPLRLLKR